MYSIHMGVPEIDALSKRYGMKVWQSYMENSTPAAGRVFWVYGPNQNDITIIGVEFTDMETTDCKWLAPDGQAPDEE